MSAPQPKQSKFEGARRPWLEDDSPADTWIPHTPKEQVERCLNCKTSASHCSGNCFSTCSPDDVKKPRYREAPNDFANVYMNGEKIDCIKKRYGVGEERIRKWVDELGLPPRRVGNRPRPMPDDFPKMVEKLRTITMLRHHYRAGYTVISRWLEEIKSAAHGGGEP